MRMRILATVLSSLLTASAVAQQSNEQPLVPFVDVTGSQRISPQDADSVAQKNKGLLDQINAFQSQADSMEQEKRAQQLMNERVMAQQVNSPANKFMQEAIEMYKPSMELEIDPKQAIVIPIGQGLLNTISTSYSELRVKTSDKTSIIETEKGELYVSPTTNNPVGLVLYDAGVPESMISLTLLPIDAPPVIVDLDVKLTSQMKSKSAQFLKQMALEEAQKEAQEGTVARSDKHTQRIIDVLLPVAQGDLPSGFTLSNEVPFDMKTPCKMAIPHIAGQRLLGGNEVIDVVVARNTSDRIYQVREEMCLSGDVIAVGIHKRAYLKPNEEVEIYILRDRHYKETKKREQRRPRLTLGE